MKKKAKSFNQRKSIRFQPDFASFVFVQLKPKGAFNPKISGLTVDESFRGCSFVALIDKGLEVDQTVKNQTGKLAPMLAEIRWTKKLTDKLMQVGIEYLE